MKSKIAIFAVAALALVAGRMSAGETEEVTGTTSGITKVVQIKGMEKAPVALEKVAPVYPREMRERGIQGFATVDILVDSSGRVVETSLVRATHPEFGSRALAAAKRWKFEPATARGKPITTRVQVPFQFVMPQVAAMEKQR
ncbi:MAG TPA: energy transducer TonB [Opitutaceae bacterium]